MVRSAKVLWCSALLLLIALMLSMVGCAMVVCGLVVYGVGWPCSYRYVPTSSTSASIEHGWTSRSREINSREIRCRCGMLHQGSRVPRSPAAAPASANPSVDHRAAAWRTIPLSPWAIPSPPPYSYSCIAITQWLITTSNCLIKYFMCCVKRRKPTWESRFLFAHVRPTVLGWLRKGTQWIGCWPSLR